jgi:hypothetical protein
MKTWNQKYQMIYEDLKEYFLSGEKICIACMVEKYWDRSIEDEGFDVYCHKQRSIIGKLKRELYLMGDSQKNKKLLIGNGAKQLYYIMDRIYLMAVDSCEKHVMFRNYKILDTAADHEIISNLTSQRIEGLMYAQEQRVNSAILVFPVAFKNRIRYIRGNIPYLLQKGKDERQDKSKKIV